MMDFDRLPEEKNCGVKINVSGMAQRLIQKSKNISGFVITYFKTAASVEQDVKSEFHSGCLKRSDSLHFNYNKVKAFSEKSRPTLYWPSSETRRMADVCSCTL